MSNPKEFHPRCNSSKLQQPTTILPSPSGCVRESANRKNYVRLSAKERIKNEIQKEVNKQVFLDIKKEESRTYKEHMFKSLDTFEHKAKAPKPKKIHTDIMEEVKADIKRNNKARSKFTKIRNLSKIQKPSIEYIKVNKSVREYKHFHKQLQGDASCHNKKYMMQRVEFALDK